MYIFSKGFEGFLLVIFLVVVWSVNERFLLEFKW